MFHSNINTIFIAQGNREIQRKIKELQVTTRMLKRTTKIKLPYDYIAANAQAKLKRVDSICIVHYVKILIYTDERKC